MTAFDDTPPTGRYILVVEDSDEDFELARRALDLLIPEATLVRAPDGSTASAYLTGQAASQPSIVLLDLELPDVDDRWLIALISARPRLARVPVFVTTGSHKIFTAQYAPWPDNWQLVSKQFSVVEMAREMAKVKIAWESLRSAGA